MAACHSGIAVKEALYVSTSINKKIAKVTLVLVVVIVPKLIATAVFKNEVPTLFNILHAIIATTVTFEVIL